MLWRNEGGEEGETTAVASGVRDPPGGAAGCSEPKVGGADGGRGGVLGGFYDGPNALQGPGGCVADGGKVWWERSRADIKGAGFLFFWGEVDRETEGVSVVAADGQWDDRGRRMAAAEGVVGRLTSRCWLGE